MKGLYILDTSSNYMIGMFPAQQNPKDLKETESNLEDEDYPTQRSEKTE